MEDFEESAFFFRDEVLPAMEALRSAADELETVTDAKLWPYPSYGQLLFGIL